MLRYVATLALLLAAPLNAPQAATIYHCKGPDGRITYSQLGCPDDQRIASQETAPAHGEAEYLLPPAKPERIVRRSRKEAAENRREITVVGSDRTAAVTGSPAPNGARRCCANRCAPG